MQISQVPSVMQFHQEYFVYNVVVPIRPGVGRYPIPDRAIGMKLRELFYGDTNGNLFEMTRIQSEDKAHFQQNGGSNNAIHKFYIEGNDIVLAPLPVGFNGGSLNFYIYLRPNQLVTVDRAATAQSFVKSITIDNSNLNVGDKFSITSYDTSGAATVTSYTAVSGSPVGNQFQIGVDSITTATNLSNILALSSNLISASNGTPSTTIVTINYGTLSTTFSSLNSSNQPTLGINVGATQGIQFDNVASTWLNPVTNVYEPLFANTKLIDFLQTNSGHRIKAYDKQIPVNGISGNVIMFNAVDVPKDLLIGDYICLANECIIPFLPPDLHNGLAERACARILAALGDQAGLAMSQQKIQEIDSKQGNLLDNRVEGSPLKVRAGKSLLRFGKANSNRRF